MFEIIVGCIIATLIIGLLFKFFLERGYMEITWHEYWITAAAISIIVIPVMVLVGWNIAKNNRMTYKEFINGWERQAVKTVTTCHRDGSCSNHYSCDPYIVLVTYTYRCGKSTCTGTRPETRYHQCPYTNEEWSYSVKTTIGNFPIDYGRLPNNPQANRWREWVSVPQSVINSAGVGDHPFWLDVKRRIDSGYAGPVTREETYTNYVLASEYSILKDSKDDVAFYRKDKLLPSPVKTENIRDYYHADKLYRVGNTPKMDSNWLKYLEYLNAQLGYQLKGDMHLVVTNHPTISNNPDRYLIATRSWWQDPDSTDKNSLGKNGILVILGVENDTVRWARATTGMPMGNEVMLKTIQSELKGIPFTPDAVIGKVSIQNKSGNLMNATIHGGVLARVALLDNAYSRVPMEQFSYLKGEIKPKASAKIWIVVITIVLTTLLWIIPLNTDYNFSGQHREYHARRYYTHYR